MVEGVRGRGPGFGEQDLCLRGSHADEEAWEVECCGSVVA